MIARGSIIRALTVLAVLFAIAGSASSASAQGADEWYGWGGARRAPPPSAQPYDAPYDDQYQRGPYNERGYSDDRDDPPADARSDDDRGYFDRRPDDDRYGDRDQGQRAYGRDDQDRDPNDRGYDDRDGYGAWDASPSPDDEARLSRMPGSNGGSRPYIQPVAPPVVAFNGPYAPGSIVIDTGGRKLYYVLNGSSAYAYPIAVGRQGFTWTGKEKISRVVDWPDWYPPADMRKRKPELPEHMLGGVNNPLGVKAIYLGNTLYRIHGTNDPKSIGKAESSGCFRMLNENVLHLASLVRIGTDVTVVRSLNGNVAQASRPSRAKASERNSPPTRWSDDRGDDRYDDRYYGRYDDRPYRHYYSDDWR